MLLLLDVNMSRKVGNNEQEIRSRTAGVSDTYGSGMERLRQDLVYALRLLIKDRAFTLTTLLTLALCVGANAAIFAVVNSVLLRPLPVPEPDRLVLLYNSYPKRRCRPGSARACPTTTIGCARRTCSRSWRCINARGVTIGGEGDAQRLTAHDRHARRSSGMLQAARYGDGFSPRTRASSARTEGHPQLRAVAAACSAAATRAVGESLRINGVPLQDRRRHAARTSHFMIPKSSCGCRSRSRADEKSDDARHSNNWTMVGRLKPGATFAQAQQQVDALNARNLERFPNMKEILINAGFHTVVTPLQEDMVAGVRRTLLLLWGGVAVRAR